MDKIFTAPNLKSAGAVTAAMLLANNFTSGKGLLIQGGAVFAAALLTTVFVVPRIS